jgi:hypothetical protein
MQCLLKWLIFRQLAEVTRERIGCLWETRDFIHELVKELWAWMQWECEQRSHVFIGDRGRKGRRWPASLLRGGDMFCGLVKISGVHTSPLHSPYKVVLPKCTILSTTLLLIFASLVFGQRFLLVLLARATTTRRVEASCALATLSQCRVCIYIICNSCFLYFFGAYSYLASVLWNNNWGYTKKDNK